MKIHELKLLIHFCDDVAEGRKTFEIRENDRGFQAGDHIHFQAVDDTGCKISHPINSLVFKITYVLSGYGLRDGYVAFAMVMLPKLSPCTKFENPHYIKGSDMDSRER